MRHIPVALSLLLLALCVPTSALAAPGDLDPTFGGSGVVTAFPPGAVATAVGIDGRGRITAVGYTIARRPDILVARFLPNGSPDPSFGGDGRVRVDLGGADYAFDVAVTGAGAVAIAGRRTKAKDRMVVVRLRTDGTRPAGFGHDGIAFIDFGTARQSADAIAFTPQGRIVTGGFITNGAMVRSALARLSPTGTLDTSFSGDGLARFDIGTGAEQIQDLLVLPGGSIVATGFAENLQDPRMSVLKVLGTGRLDASFGRSPGFTTVDVGPGGDAANALTRTPGGGYLLAGASDGDWAVVAIRPNGMIDAPYGTNGRVVLGLSPVFEEATDILTVGARTLVVGRLRGTGDDIGVVRLKPDGSRNLAFGTNGIVRVDVHGSRDAAAGAVAQNNGRLVMAGQAWRAGHPHFVVARLLNA
jgi:uncharacterized delta-60 repeat protein